MPDNFRALVRSFKSRCAGNAKNEKKEGEREREREEKTKGKAHRKKMTSSKNHGNDLSRGGERRTSALSNAGLREKKGK